ncbi:M3 family oligoendopeptidase [Patescibacteria group bacterium]|nr:M3 family oligoendopeptidase [Patescibacteria group bacterium]
MKSLRKKQTTWNLDPLFRDDNDSQIEKKRKIVERKSYEFINKWKSSKDYLKKPAVLKQALDEYENWQKNYGTGGDEWYYFWLRTAQNQNDPELKAKFNKIMDFSNKIQTDIEFFTLSIAKIPPKLQKKFLEYKPLENYKYFLEKLFAEARYLLSEAEEKILTLQFTTSHLNWVKMTSGFLAKEERKVFLEDGKRGIKNFSEILTLSSDKNKAVRNSAANALNEILEKHSDVAEAEINSILANKKINDELRKMPRPDLSRHISDDIDSKTVDTLVNSVSGRFDISKRYYKLKAKLLGIKKLKYHERNVEHGNTVKKYSYNESVNLIYKALKKLDKRFLDIFENFIKNNQIDVYPKKGKISGAFCSYNLICQPTYILLNHTDKLRDVLTMAHELGHGINNELMKEKQNATNFKTSLSTAEVASTFIEDFILQEITKQADDELRLAIMMMRLNDDISTIFRQIACYKFEQELHKNFRKKGYLSKKEIGKLFQEHMSSYMGNFVEQSPGSENWWVLWSHIRNFFYNYSYASGLLISKSLQNSVKNNPKFIDRVKDFLSAGSSDSPKNIFKKLGINITDKTFWDKGINEIENLLKEATKLAEKLRKI